MKTYPVHRVESGFGAVFITNLSGLKHFCINATFYTIKKKKEFCHHLFPVHHSFAKQTLIYVKHEVLQHHLRSECCSAGLS